MYVIGRGSVITFKSNHDLFLLNRLQQIKYQRIFNAYTLDIYNTFLYEMICPETISRMNSMFSHLENNNKLSRTTLDDIFYHISTGMPNKNVQLKYKQILNMTE